MSWEETALSSENEQLEKELDRVRNEYTDLLNLDLTRVIEISKLNKENNFLIADKADLKSRLEKMQEENYSYESQLKEVKVDKDKEQITTCRNKDCESYLTHKVIECSKGHKSCCNLLYISNDYFTK